MVVKFGTTVRSWGTLPRQNILKIAYGVHPFWANLYQKIPILAIWGAVLPHFLTHSDEIWHEDANLGLPHPSQFL